MENTTLLTVVAAFGLPCSNPELRDYPAQEMPWPAAYIRSIEGHIIIALREGIRNEAWLPKILVHELLHCGLYEERERRGQPQPRSLDPRAHLPTTASMITETASRGFSPKSRSSPGSAS